MIAVAARVAVDLNLFGHVVNEEPVTSARLAELCGAEELLIIRIMRPLSATRFVEETGPRTWKATPITAAMATEEIAAGHRMISQLIAPAMQKVPGFLLRYGYSCPIDPRDGFIQHAFRTHDTTFERMIVLEAGAPQFQAQLDMTMMAFNSGMKRTAKQWRELLESVGLRVVKIWEPVEEGADGIVEAMRD